MAERELRRRRVQRSRLEQHARLVDLELLDFVPALTPRMTGNPTERPEHLAAIAELFERIDRGEVVHALVSVPPQFGKSELLAHGGARTLARHPEWPMLYVSYGDSIASEKSRMMRDYARAAGVEMREDADAVGNWLTPAGGGLRARGIFTAITGNPARVAIVDDPHKNRAEAESALIRAKVHRDFDSSVRSRTHPESSIIVCHARWHTDDLIGRLSKEKKPDGSPFWEVINLPAILPSGQPLWHRRPLAFLEQRKRANEQDWLSLYMGEPRNRGESVFRGVGFFDALPRRYSIGRGLDLAYTKKTRAHFSCGVTMLESLDPRDRDPATGETLYYVVDVRRRQCEVPEFSRELQAAAVSWPGAGAWHWFSSSTERGVAQLLRERGVDVEDVLATVDKFSRAQPVATAWNAGRILVPRTMAALLGDRARAEDHEREPPWLKDYVDELGAFTGVVDAADDQVDATASAFESVRFAPPDPPKAIGGSGSRWEPGDRGFG